MVELLLGVVPASLALLWCSGMLFYMGAVFIVVAGGMGLLALWLLLLPAAFPGVVLGPRHPAPTALQAWALAGGIVAALGALWLLVRLQLPVAGPFLLLYYATLAPIVPAVHYIAVRLHRKPRL